jgi:alpha-D-ribose 1-methylphosphonate 5-triphosphate diphosphatase
MPKIASLRLTHAQTLMDGALEDHPLTVADGVIDTTPGREVDLTGYLLLPGIIDLHGDGFERHLTPRPTAPFDKPRALGSLAAELAVNGITTAWLAQSWSWEGGHRSGAATKALLAALGQAKAGLLPDVRVQIRLETHLVDDHPEILRTVEAEGVDFVVFNDHLPEAVEMADLKPHRFAAWAAQTSRTAEEMLAIVRSAQAEGPRVPEALTRIAAELQALGVRLGSHDDATEAARAFYRGIGAGIAEFPTTVAAAKAAHAAGEPVLMGAPNVVRGGSQTGNIAAEGLIAEGLVDALMSDYYYPALADAAWALTDRGLMGLAKAWAMISTTPARIMGLTDRGHLSPGARADLVAVNAETRRVELTLAAGHIAHLSGDLARRMAG